MSHLIDWWGFAAAVLLIELTPGPNMTWLAGLTMSEGRLAGLTATLGIGIGLMLNAVLAAWGLATMIAEHPQLESGLRYAGAALLVALAIGAWRSAGNAQARFRADAGFFAGILLNLLNPKAFLFFIVVVPPFLHGATLSLRQAMTLAVISVTIATAVHLLVVLSAAHAHGWVSDPARTRIVRRAMAAMMLGVAGWFVVG